MSSSLHNQKRILVLGGSGFLGGNLRQIFFNNPNIFFVHSNFNLDRSPKDFFVSSYDKKSIQNLIINLRIDVVLNCVGLTDVDACELNPNLNIKLNLDLPVMLDNICRKTETNLVQISTDHYASDTQIPRGEDVVMIPVNNYGLIKLQADNALLLNPSTLVVRTNFFGFNPSPREKLFDWAKERLELGQTIDGFSDVFFSPISVTLLGTILMRLIDLGETGLIHAVGGESLSKFNFLQILCKALACDSDQVQPSSIKNSLLRTSRPNYLSLSNSKMKSLMPEYNEISLSSMIRQELMRF